MKKLILVFLTALTLFSCGKEKNDSENNTQEQNVEIAEPKKEITVILDAIYEKNDTVKLYVYDKNDNVRLDKEVKAAVVGSPMNQRIELKLPQDVEAYNIAIGFSSNKSQEYFTLKSITMIINEKEVISPINYLSYFANNDQMILNTETGKHELKHEKDYPPAFGGNEQMKDILED